MSTRPRPVPTREDVESWTPEQRAGVARLLDELVARPLPRTLRIRRRLVLVVTVGGAVALFPWIAYLVLTLPQEAEGGAWRVAWVGFDVGLAATLGTAGWLAWRRRNLTMVVLPVAAALLLADAWFDLTLSWGTTEQWEAVTAAVLIEVPVAVLLLAAEITILRRASHTVAILRGRIDAPHQLWREPMVAASSERTEPSPVADRSP